MKFTVPVGDEPPPIVAVKTTFWPTVDGFGALPSVVVVGKPPAPPPLFTTCDKATLVDG